MFFSNLIHSPTPPEKGGMRFFISSCRGEGGGEKFVLEREGWFYDLLSLIYEDPSYITYILLFKFSNFVQLPPTSLSPPTSTPTVLSLDLFLWLNRWSHHSWCDILHNDDVDLHLSSLGTLVPKRPWHVFYATRHKVYGGLTHNVFFYWYSDVVITHTNTHNTLRPVDWHTHKIYIFTPPVLCSQQLPLLH